ncbi:hypothetical protein BX666DRAFT_2113679 [Dichotomocladium elegans]|nr:hypothetical protein BX666DRAFT_2113679 [Dichotomocladium elegans]
MCPLSCEAMKVRKTDDATSTASPAPFLHSLSTPVKMLYRDKDPGALPKVKDHRSLIPDAQKDPPPAPSSSPAMTAVEGYITEYNTPSKHRRTTRSYLAALLVIIIGTLLALTFILIGIGKALSSSSATGKSNNDDSFNSSTITSSEDTRITSSATLTATLPDMSSHAIASTSSGTGRRSSITTSSRAIHSGTASVTHAAASMSITTPKAAITGAVEDWI